MAIMNFSKDTKNTLALAFRNIIDQDKKSAYIEIYSSSIPKSADASATKSASLGKVIFEYPSADDPVDGVLNFKFTKGNLATDAGEAKWARLYTNSGKAVLDLDISSKDDAVPGVLVLNNTDIKKDGAILINKMVFMLG